MSARPKAGFSFQTRITAAAMGTAVCVLMVACALFTLEQWGADRARIIQDQNRLASTLSPIVARSLLAGDRAALQQALGEGVLSPRLLSAAVRAPDGRIIATFSNRATLNAPRGATLALNAPVRGQGRTLGTLQILSSLEAPGRFLPRYLGIAGALFFAATGFSLFIGRLLAQRVIEPVARLSQAMQDVAVSGDLAQRVEPAEGDEFGQLIDSFNTLLNRLHANDLELRRTMSDLTVARDQAEAANVQKSHFLANMSHEIRTPLNGVLAMAQIMALGELNDDQRGRLDVVRNSGEALLAILNDILDVSKIEAGALELESLEFDLESLVRDTVEGFSAVAQAKSVEILIDFEPALQGKRLGDPARLRQILSNLVSNALKFTVEGAVAVRVLAGPANPADGFRMIVTDTGIGISEDKLSLLFQKFTQLDSSTTRKFGGTGLGLSICQELTNMMGGAIWAKSVERLGSSFYVDLPLPRVAAADSPAPEDAVGPDEEDRPLRVLAAEDNPTNQLVLTTILEIFGADLRIVENGLLAVEALDTEAFDVVLMDIQMPVMDGLSAARRIREVEAATGRPRVPIIAVSANAMAHQVQDYIQAGMDGHVPKPIELARLHAAIERALTGSEAETEDDAAAG